MDKNNKQSISPTTNSEETTPAATKKPQQERMRLGLKLHTNIKAGGGLMIRAHEESESA